MSDTLQYLVNHGYIVLFASVLAQQLGVPLPSTPFIVAAGALAHTGQLRLRSDDLRRLQRGDDRRPCVVRDWAAASFASEKSPDTSRIDREVGG